MKDKFRLALAKKFGTEITEEQAKVLTQEEQELDDIFKAELNPDSDADSNENDILSTSKTGRGAGPNSDDYVEEGYESYRKNNVDEDRQIAATVLQGIAEYTEFKVHVSKRNN